MNNFKKLCALFIFNALFLSCAFDLVHVKQLPAQLDTTQQRKNSFVSALDIVRRIARF